MFIEISLSTIVNVGEYVATFHLLWKNEVYKGTIVSCCGFERDYSAHLVSI